METMELTEIFKDIDGTKAVVAGITGFVCGAMVGAFDKANDRTEFLDTFIASGIAFGHVNTTSSIVSGTGQVIVYSIPAFIGYEVGYKGMQKIKECVRGV